jgi:sRNA-binding regulator protein Hfq
MQLFMIYAFEKYCITREQTHFLQMITLHKHAVTVVIVAIQVSAATAQWSC